MWTAKQRGRIAEIARKTKRYPSDLTDEEWERLAPLMPNPGHRGRPREIEFREVMNAARFLVRSGCGWRMLPIHFGHWRTVYGWFRELARRFLIQTIHDVELMLDRERNGREASPSAAVVDSRSIKAPHAQTRGYDAAKKIVGRKRHIAVDTDGRLLMVNLTPADISDSEGGASHSRRHPQTLALGEASFRRWRLRPPQADGQSRLPRFRPRNCSTPRRRERFRGSSASLGRRTNIRLDDPVASARTRLRTPDRRLTRPDPRRRGRHSPPPDLSSIIFPTVFLQFLGRK
jgi:transposase